MIEVKFGQGTLAGTGGEFNKENEDAVLGSPISRTSII